MSLEELVMPGSLVFAKFIRQRLFIVIAAISLQSPGCKSSETQNPKVTANPVTTQSVAGGMADVNLNCVLDRLQNPPESFHYTFSNISANSWSEDVEVTPQEIDGSFKSGYMPSPTPIHGTPAEIPHQYQWAIGRMASLFAIVHSTSAVTNAGTEKVNGYDATKLSIDTSNGTATEKGLFNNVLGAGGFEKGTVWVIQGGCPVKLVLDEEIHAKDGSVTGKSHYEEAMVKK